MYNNQSGMMLLVQQGRKSKGMGRIYPLNFLTLEMAHVIIPPFPMGDHL